MKINSDRINNVFYDDGTYQVSSSLLSTPRRFYPIENTTARIRRDPLWVGIALIFLVSLTTLVYGDLLYTIELVVIWIIAGLAGAFGLGTAILHVDAFGHENAMLFGPIKTIRGIYKAIRDARAHVTGHNAVLIPEETETDEIQF